MGKNLCLLFVICLFTSCGVENGDPSENFKSRYLELDKIDLSQYQNPIYLQGEFDSWVTPEGELVVFTEATEKKHLFILQSTSSLPKIEGIEEVLYLDDSFFVSNGDQTYLLTKDVETTKEQQGNPYFKNKNIKNIVGYGIVHKWIDSSSEFFEKFTPLALKQEKSIFKTPEGLTRCESGGEGSSGCSITSNTGTGCSVSCDDGYYACCTQTSIGPDSCTCEKG